jgi:predicted secreted protein
MANEKLSKDLIVKLWNNSTDKWDVVARSTSYSFEVNKETIDITSFDSDGWKEFLVDLKEASLSGDSLVLRDSEAGKINYQQLLTSLVNTDTLFAIQIIDPYVDAVADTPTGGETDTPAEAQAYAHELVTGYLTQLALSASLGDKQSFSWAFQLTGKVVLVKAVYNLKTDADADTASFSEGDVILVLDQVGVGDSGYMELDTGAWSDYPITGVTE